MGRNERGYITSPVTRGLRKCHELPPTEALSTALVACDSCRRGFKPQQLSLPYANLPTTLYESLLLGFPLNVSPVIDVDWHLILGNNSEDPLVWCEFWSGEAP